MRGRGEEREVCVCERERGKRGGEVCVREREKLKVHTQIQKLIIY